MGGGIAGLTAAAYLARAGVSVLLCEKESGVGGLVNSFERGGFVFDGGIRAIEDSGIVGPMLRQLGIEVDFLPNAVSIGIGKDVMRVTSKDSLAVYQELLDKHFPDNEGDIARMIREVGKVMGYMDVLYGIDNPLFLDLKNNPGYVVRTILPWVLKYALTMPKIARLQKPVDEYLSGFTTNKALLDIIAQHFFRKTPAFFALSYFSLYLDYRYPRGGTGALSRALERFTLSKGGQIRTDTAITSVDPGKHQVADSAGKVYRYTKLLWAADLKTLYRIVDPASSMDRKAADRIQARQEVLSGKVGGDSVFTLYLAVNLDPAYFAGKSSAHFFYTPCISGLTHVSLSDLLNGDRGNSTEFISDRASIFAWLKRYLELTTYEISFPALRDSSLAPEGKTGLIVSSLFDYSLVKHIRAMGWYDEFKAFMSDCIVDVLSAGIYPGLKAAIIDRFTSTPLTIERVSGNSGGAITGWAFTNDTIPAVSSIPKVASSVFTPIPDTYQAGQWTYSPSGLPISILTGKLAADRILRDLK